METDLHKLVMRIQQGDKKAFEEFYERTKIGAFHSAYQIVHSKESAEDVLQDSYISFVRNINNIDAKQNVFSYLITITKNKALNYVTRAIPQVALETCANTLSVNPMGEIDTPLLDCCKDRFTADEWSILELCVIMGYTQSEAAKMLSRPIATLNWQLKKILKKAKDYYKEAYRE